MNETKLINFDVISTKSTKPSLLIKPLNSFNGTIKGKSKSENINKSIESLSCEKTIDYIASSTSKIIDNTSVTNSVNQILNNSISREKLEISSSIKETLKCQKSNNCITNQASESKNLRLEKESSNSSLLLPVKCISIGVLNNNEIMDINDTSTISNEVMTISSEDEGVIVHKANSETSETTLNQSQPPLIIPSCFEGTKAFRLSTGTIGLRRSISSTSPTSPSSSLSSMINTSSNNPLFTPRSYSPLAFVDDSNNTSPLRNTISVYSGLNYTFSYANSMIDDGNDNESVLAKKKKSVRFSNIVDVIDSDEKDTLAKLKALDDTCNEFDSDENGNSNQDLIFPELTTVINIENDDHELASIGSSSASNPITQQSFVMKIEEIIASIFRYIILAINSFLRIFKRRNNKKNRKNKSNQYAVINDNGISNYTTLTISSDDMKKMKLNEDDNLSQNSTVGDSIPNTISPISLNELNSSLKLDKSQLNKQSIAKNNENEIELCHFNTPNDRNIDKDNNSIDMNKMSERRMNIQQASLLSLSSLNFSSTSDSENSTEHIDTSPLTINTLSQQKSNRIVHYWYKDSKRKTMAKLFGFPKSSDRKNSSYHNKVNKVSKRSNKSKNRTLVSKIPESTVVSPKIKRSSLVNFTPTNIDINNLPNISATTTTNTILNSTSSYREEMNQNLALSNNNNNNNDNDSDNDNDNDNSNNNGIKQHHQKEIIIRDLNSNDEIYYPLSLEGIDKGKINIKTKNNKDQILSSTVISNQENHLLIEKEKETIPTSPSSQLSSSSFSESSDKEPLRKATKRFSHRRQNSVRLEVSY